MCAEGINVEMNDNWEAIRSLDEEENWLERNRVLSKTDHVILLDCAKVILEEIVDNLPVPTSPIPSSNPEYDYMNDFTDDDFKYSAAQFDVDYLEGISSEATSEPSNLTRKSLFVKFDPLVSRQSPRGKEAPIDRPRVVQKFEGDLLLLGTPPQSGISGPPHPQSGKSGGSRQPHTGTKTKSVTFSTQSPILSPLNTPTAVSHSPSQPTPSIPETADLVNVLKYSEHDLPRILEEARKEERDAEAEKYESQIRLLREKIASSRNQLQQNSRKKETFQAKIVLQDNSSKKTGQELTDHRERLQSHLKNESDLAAKHSEFKRDVDEVEEHLQLILRDNRSLENAFDDFHLRYVKQKAVNQSLSDRNKVIQQYLAELKASVLEDTDSRDKMQAEVIALEQRAEEVLESLHREHTSRMTVERTKALKLNMQLENLDKSYKQKEEEKQQVSQICDDLMRELETTNR